MTLPQTPLPSAIESEHRVSVVLNKAGTQIDNPIAGSNRWDTVGGAVIPGQGHNVRVSFSLSDKNEQIRSAQIKTFDANSALTATYNFKPLLTLDTTTLKATADLIAGKDIPSSVAGTRSVFSVTTSRKRRLEAQTWVRDVGTDCFLVGGTATTLSAPYVIMTDDATIGIDHVVPVSFFASWNDEVGRQHGEDVAALTANVVKPYGGSKTVEVVDSGGTPFTGGSEANCENIPSLTIPAAGDGVVVKMTARFRSKLGSGDYIVCDAYVKFVDCSALVEPDCSIFIDISILTIYYPPDIPGNGDTTTIDIDDGGSGAITAGKPVTIHVQPLRSVAYAAGVGNAQKQSHLFIKTGSKITQNFTSSGNQTIDLSGAPTDTQGWVIWATHDVADSKPALAFNTALSEYTPGVKKGPTISAVASVTNTGASFTLDNDGGAEGNMTVEYLTIPHGADKPVTGPTDSATAIATGTGSRTFAVDVTDESFGAIFFSLKNGQGQSNILGKDAP